MKAGQIAVLVLAALAVGAIALAAGGGGGGDKEPDRGAGKAAKTAPKDAIRISFAYSTEKPVLLEDLIKRFNDSGTESGGRPVFVEPQVIASGEAETQIAAGRL